MAIEERNGRWYMYMGHLWDRGWTILDVTDLELAGSRVAANDATAAGLRDVGSWREAMAACEKSLLQRLYPLYPSSRKLAVHLGTSHNMIARKLRRYGIPAKR